jgi:mannose-6-phosphate isomerase-like protein (cupin superfamily)
MSSLRRTVPVPLVLLLVALGIAGGAVWAQAQSAAPTAIRNQLAASTDVLGAKNRTLGLSRVIIPPGTKLALHHHLGTQAVYIQSGELRYTVHDGSVSLMRGLADANPTFLRKIKAGQTGTLRPGTWFVEQPSDHHSAENKTGAKVVVLQASLLKTGAPPATPVSSRRR